MAQQIITNADQLEKEKDRGYNFFGYEIRPKDDQRDQEDKKVKIVSPVPPSDEEEGGFLTVASGFYGQVMDVRGDAAKNDRDLLVKYRNAALQPECDSAIEDIVNEAIVNNGVDPAVILNLDQIEDDDLDDKTKEVFQDEFKEVLGLLRFKNVGSDIFRQWYIDGKIVYHKVIDVNKPEKGIQELRRINPIKIQKVREIEEDTDNKTAAKLIHLKDEYFLYSEDGFGTTNTSLTHTASGVAANQDMTGLKIAKDSIAYITSGLLDVSRRSSLSHLQKALRIVNQLRMMEDALVIYRLARAPERRLFYIDIGTMGEKKGMEYVQKIMNTYRNKITYDAQTGDVTQDARQMNMLEDFWLPRREGGKGTEISNLPGGQNLGEIEDIVYFQKKLYKSLNVPINRLDNESGFAIGRSTEISRDELKFQKFVDRLRQKFSELFKDLLKTQLILKRIIKLSEWEEVQENIVIDYVRDSYFAELKEAEILRERLTTLQAVEPYIGRYWSEERVMKDILMMTDEDIKTTREEIYNEAIRKRGDIKLPKDDADQGDFAPEAGAPPGGGDVGGIPGEGGDIPDTGLGGVNDVPTPPGGEQPLPSEDDAPLDSEDGETDPTEPTINPQAADFPTLEDDEDKP